MENNARREWLLQLVAGMCSFIFPGYIIQQYDKWHQSANLVDKWYQRSEIQICDAVKR